MNRDYRMFGQGLTMRGNTRPSIATAGIWGANYNPGDLSQRQFLMRKDMSRPTFTTSIGLSTEQKAYNNLVGNGNNRSSFGVGFTGTGGLFRTGGSVAQMPRGPPINYKQMKMLLKRRTGGLQKQNKRSKKNKRRCKRRTGGNYADIRNAINRASTSGCYKKKSKRGNR